MAKTEIKKRTIKDKPKPKPSGVRIKLLRSKKVWDGIRWNYMQAGEVYRVDKFTASIWLSKNQAKLA